MKRIFLHLKWLVFALILSQPTPASAQDETSLNPLELTQKLLVSRQEYHQWERHVRGFRREHNFALSTGASTGIWQVRRLGSMTNREFSASGVFTRFQYSFHLPLYKGFGYFLGSSAGYQFESVDQRSEFRPVSGIMFPGLLLGLVLNFNPIFRFSAGADAYLERHNGITERDEDGDHTEISATLQTYDFGSFLDIFYDLAWAIRLEGHLRRVDYLQPKKAQGFAVEANIKKRDRWIGLGIVYHLL